MKSFSTRIWALIAFAVAFTCQSARAQTTSDYEHLARELQARHVATKRTFIDLPQVGAESTRYPSDYYPSDLANPSSPATNRTLRTNLVLALESGFQNTLTGNRRFIAALGPSDSFATQPPTLTAGDLGATYTLPSTSESDSDNLTRCNLVVSQLNAALPSLTTNYFGAAPNAIGHVRWTNRGITSTGTAGPGGEAAAVAAAQAAARANAKTATPLVFCTGSLSIGAMNFDIETITLSCSPTAPSASCVFDRQVPIHDLAGLMGGQPYTASYAGELAPFKNVAGSGGCYSCLFNCNPANMATVTDMPGGFEVPTDGLYYRVPGISAAVSGKFGGTLAIPANYSNGSIVAPPSTCGSITYVRNGGFVYIGTSTFPFIDDWKGTPTLPSNCPPLATTDPLGEVTWGNHNSDCRGSTAGSIPLTANPVVAATGAKAERAVDLRVAVTGEDFELVREFTSDSGYLGSAGGNLAGRGWAVNVGRFVRARRLTAGSNGTVQLIVDGWPTTEHVIFNQSGTGSTARWVGTGPVTQEIVQVTLQSTDGVPDSTNVFRLREPGGREVDFLRPTLGTTVGAEVTCRVLRERDAAGNSRAYSYYQGGGDRVRAILLNGTPGIAGSGSTVVAGAPAEATIVFEWADSGNLLGKLRSAEVRRFDATARNFVVTDRVDYRYLDELTSGYSPDLADSGSSNSDVLVQVTCRTLVGETQPGQVGGKLLPRVTQYRYHRGVASDPLSADERLNVVGGSHQIKCVLGPDQIEYYVQRYSGTLSGSPLDYVPEGAATLLTLDDGDTAFTEASTPFKVIDLASKVVGYDLTSGRVTSQFLQTSCGCGGPAQGVKLEYTYLGTTSNPSTRIDEIQYNTSTSQFDTLYRRTYLDMERLGDDDVVHLKYRVLQDASAAHTWVEGFEYDSSGRLVKELTPAVYTAYAPATGGGSPSAATATASTSSGLIRGFVYNSDNRVTERRICVGTSQSVGSGDLVEKIVYETGSRRDLPAERHLYKRNDSAAAADVELTTYDYGFHDPNYEDTFGSGIYNARRLSFIKTVSERETSGENGPGGDVTTFEFFDTRGRNEWSMAADGTLVHRTFSDQTGEPTSTVANANPAGRAGVYAPLVLGNYANHALVGTPAQNIPVVPTIPAGVPFGRWAEGGDIRTTYQRDLLGRVVSVTIPGGDVSGTPAGVPSYSLLDAQPLPTTASGHQPILFLTELELPYQLPDGTFDGPAVVIWKTAGGQALWSSSFELEPSPYDPLDLDYDLGTELSRSVTAYTLSGLAKQSQNWWDIAGDLKYTTTFEYDGAGRLTKTTSQTGTIKRSVFDVLDRVVEEYSGNGSSEQKTTAYGYDTTTSGVGNGNLTRTWLYTGEVVSSSEVVRETQRVFDDRDRLVKVINPTPPHQYFEYDNLDRAIRTAWFSSTPSAIDTPLADRGKYEEVSFSQRGLPYRTRRAADPTASTLVFLQSNTWYDSMGRALAEWGATSAGIKRQFDGFGRVTKEYVTDRGGDSDPGASDSYSHAISLTGDKVIEQTETSYADHSSRWTGLPLMTTTLRRVHGSTATGELSSAGSSPTAVASYRANYYDAANRVIRSVDFGTNTAATSGVAPTGIYEADDEVPTWPPSSAPDPSASDLSKLITATQYNTRGLVHTATSAREIKTQFFYDDLGRTVSVAENTDGTLSRSDLSFSTSTGLWTVAWLNSDPTVNRTTSTVFDSADHVIKHIAHKYTISGDAPQVTQYVFGVTAATSTPGTLDSLASSGDLLYEVIYPDQTPPTSGDTAVRLSYNKLGEVRGRRDQRGVVRRFILDESGRPRHDIAETIPTLTPAIDTQVRRLETTYDAFGRVRDVLSHDNTDTSTPSIKNAVRFRYSPLWETTGVYQDHDGPIQTTGGDDGTPAGNTQLLSHTYDLKYFGQPSVTVHNFSRRDTTTYPDGTVVSYRYGASDSIDDRVSRIDAKSLPSSGTPFVQYGYIGAGMTAYVDYPWSDVQLDRTLDAPGYAAGTRNIPAQSTSGAPVGKYPGYDRFGRVRTTAWVDGALENHSRDSDVPNIPPLVHERYRYDNASRSLDKIDVRPGVRQPVIERRYTHDNLNRLSMVEVGVDNGTWTPGPGRQEWDLDALGNWLEHRVDTDSDSTFEFVETRSAHNGANEVTSRTLNSVSSGVSYDSAGNTLVLGEGATDKHYFYDAWNRLVTVEIHGSAPLSWMSQLGSYRYNGLGWRITSTNGTVIPMESRTLYYDESWRLVEEHVHSDPMFLESEEPANNWVVQEFWGVRSIDDPVLRRIRMPNPASEGAAPDRWDFEETVDSPFYHLTDRQFSTIAMIFATGLKPPIFERVEYDPYGNPAHHFGADCDLDGDIDWTDVGLGQDPAHIGSIGDGVYDVAVDFNRDGESDLYDGFDVYPWLFPPPVQQGQISCSATYVSNFGPAPNNVFGYAGYVHLGNADAYKVRNRDYVPTAGRWLERDPLGLMAGPNLYAYGDGMPLETTDPEGLCPTRTDSYFVDQYWEQINNKNDGLARAIFRENLTPAQQLEVQGVWLAQEAETTDTLTNSRLVRMEGGMNIVASKFTFGASDKLGWTNSDAYTQNSGYGASHAIAGVSRELFLVATGTHVGRIAQGGGRAAMYLNQGFQAYNRGTLLWTAGSGGYDIGQGRYVEGLTKVGLSFLGAKIQGPRTFVSKTDVHAAEIATKIEARYPGLVRGIEIDIFKKGMATTDTDILLKNAALQLKDTKKLKGIVDQLAKSAQEHGVPAYGFNPKIQPGALKEAVRQGATIFKTEDELMNAINPLRGGR